MILSDLSLSHLLIPHTHLPHLDCPLLMVGERLKGTFQKPTNHANERRKNEKQMHDDLKNKMGATDLIGWLTNVSFHSAFVIFVLVADQLTFSCYLKRLLSRQFGTLCNSLAPIWHLNPHTIMYRAVDNFILFDPFVEWALTGRR